MSEEETKIIENKELTEQEKIFYTKLFVKNINESFNKIENEGILSVSVYKSDIEAIQGTLDLYNQEKEKSSRLESETKQYIKQLNSAFSNGFIHKDKIKEIKGKADKDHCYQYKIFYDEVVKLLKEN